MSDIPFVRSPLVAFTLGIGVALAATIGSAQPTGNPKGTMAPTTQGESAKAPASRATPIDSATKPAGGAAAGLAANAVAHTPGGGTAGGLTGRHPQGDSGDPKQNSTPQSIPQKK